MLLTAMTGPENLNLISFAFNQSTIAFLDTQQSGVKMKTDVEDHINDILERHGLPDVECEESSQPCWPTVVPERSSWHLSGGCILTPTTNPFHPTFEDSSPTTERPFSFVFSISQSTQTEEDLKFIKESTSVLQTSGFYHKNVCWRESVSLLQFTQPGTFFIRDSGDPNFMYSLSLQTVRGPTSVRLHYVNGRFRLDAEPCMVSTIPTFESVLDLVEYYMECTETRKRKKSKHKISPNQVWVDIHGQVYSNILLLKPLKKQGQVPQLQHLCRLKVNSMLRTTYRSTFSKRNSDGWVPMNSLIESLKLPKSLLAFLKQYPHSK